MNVQVVGGECLNGDIVTNMAGPGNEVDFVYAVGSPWTITKTFKDANGNIMGIIVETYTDNTFARITKRQRTK